VIERSKWAPHTAIQQHQSFGEEPQWDIGIQKTGYISEAGQCLVMQAHVAGRKLIMVFLDSAGKLSRIADAERVRRWIETSHRSAAGHPVVTARQG